MAARVEDSGRDLMPMAKPPDGIDHHYPPLAVISVNQNVPVTVSSLCQKTLEPIPKPVRSTMMTDPG
jgi:hypothetical protein